MLQWVTRCVYGPFSGFNVPNSQSRSSFINSLVTSCLQFVSVQESEKDTIIGDELAAIIGAFWLSFIALLN